MPTKRLVFIYNTSVASHKLVQKDVAEFYGPLSVDDKLKKADISIAKAECPDAETLVDELEGHLKDDVELYLHFSGHGSTGGIPYDKWVLKNDNFAAILNDRKIRFCFFSSCKSDQLAKLVSRKNIPIVIATNGNIDLTNTFAIRLQQEFYKYLLDKKSFKDALEKAVAYVNAKTSETRHDEKINDLKITQNSLRNDDDDQKRGEGGSDAKMNDLQIIQNSLRDNTDIYLIPPGIREAIDSIDDLENLLLVYYQDEAILGDFKKQLSKGGYESIIRVIAINDHDCATLQKSGWTIGTKVNLKILMLISVEEILNEYFKQLFDNPSLFKPRNPPIRLALTGNIKLNQVVQGTKALSALAHNNRFYYTFNDIKELFKEDAPFLTFLTYEEVEYETRLRYTYVFSCDPSKNELNSTESAKAHFFYLQSTQPKVAYFLINYLRHIKQIDTPNIIVRRDSKAPESLLSVFEKKIQEQFGADKKWKLKKLISQLIDKPYVVIIDLDQDDVAEVVESLNNIINSFFEAFSDYNDEDSDDDKGMTSTFVFVLHSVEPEVLPTFAGNLMTLKISNPNEISEQNVADWRKSLTQVDKQEANKKIIDEAVNKIDLKTDKTPPGVIAKICEVFRIPGNKILSVS